MPERETPGREREALGEADEKPLAEAQVPHLLPLGAPVGPVEDEGEHGEQDRDLPRLAEALLDHALEGGSDQRRRHGRDDDDPGDLLVLRLDGTSPHAAEPGDHVADQIAPEVRHDGDERAEMERDVERLVELLVLLQVRPVAGPRDEDQVPRRRDRQQLGEPLHEAEDQRLPVREGRSPPPPSRSG